MKKTIVSFLVIGALLISPTSFASAKSNSGPTAKCRDGSYSYSLHHRGTCSHHKGVRVWYR